MSHRKAALSERSSLVDRYPGASAVAISGGWHQNVGGRMSVVRGKAEVAFQDRQAACDPKRKPSVQSSLMNHLFCDPTKEQMNVRKMAVGCSGCSDQPAETTCDADALLNIPVVGMHGRGRARRVAGSGCRRRVGFLHKAVG